MAVKERWYYDIGPDPLPEELEDGLFPVQRIYCLALDDFAAPDWERLYVVLENLPHYIGLHQGMHYWFSADEENDPFLSAWTEPPGLQVFGLIPPEDWRTWDQGFRALANDLPWRTPTAETPREEPNLT